MGFTLEIGAQAPDFKLPGVDGKDWSLGDFADQKIVVVVFSCNHCPYVVGSEDRMNRFYADYRDRGVGMIAINANEIDEHTTDSFEHMVERARQKGFAFPYVRDASQEVAIAYGGQRTPHYFVLDEERRVRYTGRMDDNPREAGQETTHELRDAVDEVLAGRPVRVPVTDAIGCNVKWWGKDAHWMPESAAEVSPYEFCDVIIAGEGRSQRQS